MPNTSGTQYKMDGLTKVGEVVEYKITDTNWSMSYRIEGVEYFEQATSTDGFTYEGTWGEKGKIQIPNRKIKLEKYVAKNGKVLMLGEWFDGDSNGGDYIYRLSPGK